jgi:hypothetical protein
MDSLFVRQTVADRSKFDGLVKSPTNTNFQISHLIILIGCEIEI